MPSRTGRASPSFLQRSFIAASILFATAAPALAQDFHRATDACEETLSLEMFSQAEKDPRARRLTVDQMADFLAARENRYCDSAAYRHATPDMKHLGRKTAEEYLDYKRRLLADVTEAGERIRAGLFGAGEALDDLSAIAEWRAARLLEDPLSYSTPALNALGYRIGALGAAPANGPAPGPDAGVRAFRNKFTTEADAKELYTKIVEEKAMKPAVFADYRKFGFAQSGFASFLNAEDLAQDALERDMLKKPNGAELLRICRDRQLALTPF